MRRLHRRDRRARPRGRRGPRARAAARRQDPRAGRRRRSAPRRDRGVLGRQRDVGAGRRARARARLRRPARGLRVRPGPLRARSGGASEQPGGRLLALRAGRARARVAAELDHGGQRRDLRDAARVLHRRRPDHGPRPVAAVQHGQARPARRVRAGGRAREKMVPSLERRVRPQAADDEPHVADPAPGRHALAARLSARLRADDPLAPAAALRARRSCTCSRWPPNVALVGARRGRALHGRARPPAARCCWPPRSPALLHRSPAAGRPLLRAHRRPPAAGLWDWLRHGTAASWEAAEGTR